MIGGIVSSGIFCAKFGMKGKGFCFNTGVSKMTAADRNVSLYFEAEFLMQGFLTLWRFQNGEWWLFVENVNFL
jgi:hypothetical protein